MNALRLPTKRSSEARITPMTRRHIPRAVELEAQAYPRGWSRSVFRSELDQVGRGGRRYLAAVEGRRLVGYAGLWVVAGTGGSEAHITNIVVDPDHRRCGVATRLLVALAREARGAGVTGWTLEVRASATGAQELYRGFGFAPAGVRKAYYEQGEDAVVMWCHSIGDDGYDGLLDQLELGEGRS